MSEAPGSWEENRTSSLDQGLLISAYSSDAVSANSVELELLRSRKKVSPHDTNSAHSDASVTASL